MNNKINIPEPCFEDWNSMQQLQGCKRHCAACKCDVHDFTKSSFTEINKTIQAAGAQKICGNYHERHTNPSKAIYAFVNALEEKLIKIRLRKVSILFVTASLFLSGCYRRSVKGCAAYAYPEKKKHGVSQEK